MQQILALCHIENPGNDTKISAQWAYTLTNWALQCVHKGILLMRLKKCYQIANSLDKNNSAC